MGSFSTALSGLTANTTALDVVGDNLANMNTQGFKGNVIEFEDAMAQATASLQIGDGVGSTLTGAQLHAGHHSNHQRTTGRGHPGQRLFRHAGQLGEHGVYTRDGSFTLNAAGQLVTNTGALVQGWNAVNGAVNPSGPLAAITVPLLSAQAPVATQNMSLNANLDASAATGDDVFGSDSGGGFAGRNTHAGQ